MSRCPGLIAIVTFAAAYVPYVGVWVSGIFAVALAGGRTETAIIVLAASGILQEIVEPIAVGAALSLNPLVVLIVTIAGGCLFGLVGLVLSAPPIRARRMRSSAR